MKIVMKANTKTNEYEVSLAIGEARESVLKTEDFDEFMNKMAELETAIPNLRPVWE